MHLLRQIPQNYVIERRICVFSRTNFIGGHVRRRALDTLVRTFNVSDSCRDDKNTHGDAYRKDCSFISEPFAKHKQGTDILSAVFTGHLAIPLQIHSEFPIIPWGSALCETNTTLFSDYEEITHFKHA
jgi:hypothetical protein